MKVKYKTTVSAEPIFEDFEDTEDAKDELDPDYDENYLEEDIETVMEQANVDKKTAVKALEKNNGDLAAAILDLSENGG